MRTTLLPITALFLICTPASAQLHAGEVPIGSAALNVGIDISLPAPNSQDSATFEIDCDDQPDMSVRLIHGQPAVDNPNYAILHLLDGDLEVCANLSVGQQQRPKYYAVDELLDCAGDFDWQSPEYLPLGDFGSFTTIGPATIDNMYLAYRRGVDVGWILLSFNLNEDLAPSLQVQYVLPICPGTTSIAQHDPAPALSLFPNPSNGEPVRVQSTDVPRSIEVLDATGRSVAQYSGAVRTIAAPPVAGTYLVRTAYPDGRRSVARLVRY